MQLRFDLVTDENSKNLLQNSEYRELILGNENKMKIYREEIKETQKMLEIREAHIERLRDEILLYKQQIEELGEKIKEKNRE